jgi:hypothetical protein
MTRQAHVDAISPVCADYRAELSDGRLLGQRPAACGIWGTRAALREAAVARKKSPEEEDFDRKRARLKAQIMRDRSLKTSARCVGWQLVDLLSFKQGYAWHEQQQIAEEQGIDVRTVQTATKALARYFSVQASGRNRRYYPVFDLPVRSAASPEKFSGEAPPRHRKSMRPYRKKLRVVTGNFSDVSTYEKYNVRDTRAHRHHCSHCYGRHRNHPRPERGRSHSSAD